MDKKLTLSGYKKNEDGSFQRNVESVDIEDLIKGGFKYDKNESALGDNFLLIFGFKKFSNQKNVRIYITENDYQKFRNSFIL